MSQDKKDRNVGSFVTEHEYWLAKYKFIQNKYPDAKVHGFVSNIREAVTFSTKTINPIYTNFNVVKGYNTLFVEAYLEEEFDFNGNKELIKIYTSPKRSRLAHIAYPRDPKNPKIRDWKSKKIIKFTKFRFNLKTRNMSDNCFNECRAAIMQFIKDNPKMDLDTKHLDPSLKKLMIFN